MTYSNPKLIGITAANPLIMDWNGSIPKEARLKNPTLTPQITTPITLIKIRFFLSSIICPNLSPVIYISVIYISGRETDFRARYSLGVHFIYRLNICP